MHIWAPHKALFSDSDSDNINCQTQEVIFEKQNLWQSTNIWVDIKKSNLHM